MKCDDCLNVIEEYFDAELDRTTANEVAAHLSACVECSEAYESLKQEQAVYANYQRDVEVTSALWAGIQARINQEAAQISGEKAEVKQGRLLTGLRGFFASLLTVPRFSPALAAALVVFAIGATVVVMSYLHSRSETAPIAKNPPANNISKPEVNPTPVPPPSGNEQNPGTVAKNDKEGGTKVESNNSITHVKAIAPKPRVVERAIAKEPNSPTTAEQLLHDAEQKYVAAIAILKRDYDKRRSQLDAATIARFDAALQNIDRTIAATKAAVNKNPDDPIALQYMLAAYAKKVEVLKDITGS